MNPSDFKEIGITGKGWDRFWILLECPKCAALLRADTDLAAVKKHIEWHEGLFDGWQDA